jgi:predicted O-linked N-acetylglucosamine transferase (SPINDLY family)
MTGVTIDAQLQQARLLAEQGRWDQADALLRQVLAADPHRAEAHHLLGLVAWRNGDQHIALASLEHAASLAPDSPVVQFDFACVLLSNQQFGEAVVALRKVVQLAPNERGGWNNLGGALVALGQHEEAAACFARAIELAPQLSQYHANLAKAMEVLGRLDEAEASARRAVELAPQGGSESAVLASVLVTRGRLGQGIEAYQRALSLSPQLNLARFNLASALRLQGRVEESIATYRDAIARDPTNARGHSALLLTLHCSPAITPQALFDEHRAWAASHADSLGRDVPPHENDRSPDRKLRIGYVSPDLREHAVARFIEPALALDPGQFEVFCYAEEFRGDEVTRRLKSLVPNWHNTVALSDEEMSREIRADRIDILVDLAGHTADNRLLVFARRPAPVQATYLGYPNTTGMAAMDWRISDELADPVGMTEALHTERLMRLTGCAWCYRPPEGVPDPRRARGLGDPPITFASFNALAKVSTNAIQLWSRILTEAAGSRLLIKSAAFEDAHVAQSCRDAFARHGIDPQRLDLVSTTPSVAEHLAMYDRVDVALDTMPYNGTTTTCEALWMGVPVVTLAGKSHVSGVGASLLTHAGLGELVAESPEQYVELAVRAARDAMPRMALRQRMQASALMDAPRMTRNLADAYRAMWKDWINTGRT